MNTDNLILRETDNAPLINNDDTLTNAQIDANFINIYNDFLALSQANDPTLIYDVDRSYLVDEYATYDGRLWIAIEVSTGVTPIEGSAEWNDVFPTVLAHEKNKDTILDEGGANETTVAEIRAFIDAGLTSTTNLSLTTKTGTSFKIESSTGTDVTIPQATNVDAGLLNSEDKVKLDNTSGINTGDQTLISLSGEDVTNKVVDFTTINNTLYPTTQAVDTYLTAQIPDLVETFLDSNVELNTNKAIDFTTINNVLYPSVSAVNDQLDLKVDVVVGSRLITSAEGTKLDNTSGTNTGDQIISDATITTTDITTNNFTTSKHGFVPKGTNVGNYLKDDGTWSTISAGGLTFFTEAQSTTAPNATVPVDSLTAVSSAANADMALLPKGTGAFIVGHIPLNTYDTGIKRGNYAVDIQPGPFSYNGGASGIGSVAIGYQNQVTGNYGVSIGLFGISSGTASVWLGGDSGGVGVASGDYSVAMQLQSRATNSASFAIQNGNATGVNAFAGNYGTASGTNSLAMAGETSARSVASNTNSVAIGAGCVSDARSSISFGMYSSSKGVAQRLSLGSFQDVVPYLVGNSQLSISSSVATTTTNTAVELVAYNGTAINLVLQNNEAIRVRGSIIGKQTATTNVACYDFDCVIVRGVGVATTILPLSNLNLILDTIVLGTAPTLTANTTLGGLSVKSGAKSTTTIKWSCRIDSTEVILA